MLGSILGIILLGIVIAILISCVKIVKQAQALVVERLGAYQATWGTGLHFKIPIIDRVARRVDLKEQVVDFAPQPLPCGLIRLSFIRSRIRKCSVMEWQTRSWLLRT